MPVPNYKINYAAQTDPKAAFKTSVQSNQLNVFAPPQKLKPVATFRPQVSRQLGRAQVERGWRNVPQNQADEFRQQFARQGPVPQTLPPKPGLPVKPQFVTGPKGGEKPANQASQGQRPPEIHLKPFVQQPLEEQKRQAGRLENRKPEETSNRPPSVAEENRGGPERPKVESEHAQRNGENKHPGEAERHGGHGEPQKGKKEEVKKEEPKGPPPSQSKNDHHNAPPEERIAKADPPQQHHADPSKSHPPQPHRGQPNNQKKKEQHN
jgi:hypothetical protein